MLTGKKVLCSFNMKRNLSFLVLIAVLGLLTACPSGGGGDIEPGPDTGKLTITGLPGGGKYAVYVFASGTDVSSFAAITAAYTSGSYQAFCASPSGNVFTLSCPDGVTEWTVSGNLPVLLYNESGSPAGAANPLFRQAVVNFSGGNAAIADILAIRDGKLRGV